MMNQTDPEQSARSRERDDQVAHSIPSTFNLINPGTTATDCVTGSHLQHLRDHGYVKFEGLFNSEQVDGLRTKIETLWKDEGAAAGFDHSYREKEVRRLANLIAKGEEFKSLVFHPVVLQCAEDLFGGEHTPKLIMCNARDPGPRGNARQIWHTDAGKDIGEYGAMTAILYLDHSRAANGATIILPGSHKDRSFPPEKFTERINGEISIEAAPGDLVILNGHIWHAGGANSVDDPRRTLLAHYYRDDVPFEPTVGVYLTDAQKECFSAKELSLLHLKDKPPSYS